MVTPRIVEKFFSVSDDRMLRSNGNPQSDGKVKNVTVPDKSKWRWFSPITQ